MKILVIQFHPVPCHLIPLRPKFLHLVFLVHVSLCSLHVTDQDAQVFKQQTKLKLCLLENFYF